MNLRPYQEEIISKVLELFKRKQNILIQAPTGAGKTIIFASLIKHLIQNYPKLRICVLVHREILVRQNVEKMLKIWPDAPVGISCASISSKKDSTQQITFASVQTLARRLNDMEPMHILIVDEVHRLPPQYMDSQYKEVITRMQTYFADLRIVGFSATPYRLNHGAIYGCVTKRTRQEMDSGNWFAELDHCLGIAELQDLGFLCDVRALEDSAQIKKELSGVKLTAGEYNSKQLSNLMQKEVHLKSALKAYQEHCEGRTRCVVYTVDIQHCETLAAVFTKNGISADFVHSMKSQEANAHVLEDFSAGRLPVLCNVGVLTEGWDCPAVDMMILARPTQSAALFVQMIGRGLRIFPGKKDLLVLDLAACFKKHGPPHDPKLPHYEPAGEKEETLEEKADQALKICPKCKVEFSGGWVCPTCGHIFQKHVEIVRELKLKEVECMRKEQIRKVEELRAAEELIGKLDTSGWHLAPHITRNGDACVCVSGYMQVMKGGHYLKTARVSHYYRITGPAAYHLAKWVNNNTNQPTEVKKGWDVLRNSDEDLQECCNFLKDHLRTAEKYPLLQDGKFYKVKGW